MGLSLRNITELERKKNRWSHSQFIKNNFKGYLIGKKFFWWLVSHLSGWFGLFAPKFWSHGGLINAIAVL